MYGGRSGNKLCVEYKNEKYILKLPPKPNGKSAKQQCAKKVEACRLWTFQNTNTNQRTLRECNL